MSKEQVQEIMKELEATDDDYKKEALDEALALKVEIIPHLIALLERVAADPEKYCEDKTYFGHIYALMLLAYFKAEESHDVIIKIFSLPGDLALELFDEIVIHELLFVLYATHGKSLDKIKKMALNPEINVYCRISALDSLVLCAAAEEISREDLFNFYRQAFADAFARKDAKIITWLVWSASELNPEELMTEVNKAYELKMVDTEVIPNEDIQKALESPKDASLKEFRLDLDDYMESEFHARMEEWLSYDDEEGEEDEEGGACSCCGASCDDHDECDADDEDEIEEEIPAPKKSKKK